MVNSKWYEGAAIRQPSTNIGLEANNKDIKAEYILHERQPVGQFMNGIGAILVKWFKH